MNALESIPTERKPYAEPQLIEYGDLEALTQGSGPFPSDQIAGSLPG